MEEQRGGKWQFFHKRVLKSISRFKKVDLKVITNNMSHFTVAIIHDESENIDEILAPFSEQDYADEYREFEVEVEAGKEAEYQKRELESDYWEKPENFAKQQHYLKLDPVSFVKEYSGYEQNEKGDWGYYCNLNSRWYWYQIGGRWKDMLKLKEGAEPVEKGESTLLNNSYVPKEGWCDSAKVKDIDWEGMKSFFMERAEKWWNNAMAKKLEMEKEGKKPEAIQSELAFHHSVYKDDTKKSYIERHSKFCTYSILKDGEWLEPGKMGWWGISHAEDKDKQKWEEEYMNYLSGLDPESVITIVDCHI